MIDIYDEAVDKIIIHECPGCGKQYKTEKGLNAHLEKCKDYFTFKYSLKDNSVVVRNPLTVKKYEFKITTSFEIEIEELKKEVEEIKNQLKLLNLWKE